MTKPQITYTIKYPLPGFDHIEEVYLKKKDKITSLLKSTNDNNFHLYLINAATDKKYFEIPLGIKTLLDINDTTNYSVYFIIIIDIEFHNSTINLGAPILFNEDNCSVAQCIINNDATTIRELDFINLPNLNLSEKQNLKISNLISGL